MTLNLVKTLGKQNFTDITVKLAEFIKNTAFEDIPTDVITKGKERILDTIGCILAGSNEEVAKIILGYVESIGGTPEARIIGFGRKTSVQNAALANGTIGHALDFDDSQLSLMGHPSVVILPSVLSIAEKKRASGRKVLEAFLIGFEVACKIGRGVNPKLYNNGWHATSVIGVLGAAASAGKLLDLGVAEMSSAIGIAASHACGLRENFGTMTKPLHAGRAAENGVISAILAKHGFTASKNIIEAKRGFCGTFSGVYELKKIVDHLGDPYEIVLPGVHTKSYPSCLATHTMIDATIALANENNIKAEDVESVECGVGSLATELLIHNSPKTSLEGKFSAQFVTAISLLDRRASLGQFIDEKVQDPKTVNLMKKIKMVSHPDLVEIPILTPSIITVKLKDGREFSKRVDIAKGHPENPLSRDEIVVKFRDCAEPIIGRNRVDRSSNMIWILEKIEDINQLMDEVSVKEAK